MDEKYLYPQRRSVWAISRLVGGRWVSLIQGRPLDEPGDGAAVLHALGMAATAANLDRNFPRRGAGDRCPTLALLERCNVLDPTNPYFKRLTQEVGV
jgi:hypothetical protein